MKSLEDYAQKYDPLRENCPVRAALDLIRGRWKPSILHELKSGAKRFSDLQCTLGRITVQLRQLEADGVVSRRVYPEVPMRVEYALTDFGRSLSDILDRLEVWGTEYLARQGRACPARNA